MDPLHQTERSRRREHKDGAGGILGAELGGAAHDFHLHAIVPNIRKAEDGPTVCLRKRVTGLVKNKSVLPPPTL